MKKRKRTGWKTNTFHHGEFWDILKLVEEKEKKGLTISSAFHTLNEEKLLEKRCSFFVPELMERYPLVDEFAVIDSGSQDKTLKLPETTEQILTLPPIFCLKW